MNVLIVSQLQVHRAAQFTADQIGPDTPKAELDTIEMCQNT